jgi:hypothetical protein
LKYVVLLSETEQIFESKQTQKQTQKQTEDSFDFADPDRYMAASKDSLLSHLRVSFLLAPFSLAQIPLFFLPVFFLFLFVFVLIVELSSFAHIGPSRSA